MVGRKSFAVVLSVCLGSSMTTVSADIFNMGPGLISMDTVLIHSPGNVGYQDFPWRQPAGAVDYEYRIGVYEVTAAQYTVFLNAVAGVDTYELYDTRMATHSQASKIFRVGGSGTELDPWQYEVAPDYANRPANFVSWAAAARFANWVHNGQPTGLQDLSTTESGAYFLHGANTNEATSTVTRDDNWLWALPTRDEWVKAGYYDAATDSYFIYPTSSNDLPGRDLTDANGNNANYADPVLWPPQPVDNPYFTTVVGNFANSASPYGTFDQGGNVSELTETLADNGVSRVWQGGDYVQGGSYLMTNPNGAISPVTTRQGNFGFRLVQRIIDEILLLGDADRNGVVNDLDLAILQQNLGMSGAVWDDGDFDGDGMVSLYDAYLLLTNYSPSMPQSATLSAVPEPASLALLALGGMTLLRRRG